MLKRGQGPLINFRCHACRRRQSSMSAYILAMANPWTLRGRIAYPTSCCGWLIAAPTSCADGSWPKRATFFATDSAWNLPPARSPTLLLCPPKAFCRQDFEGSAEKAAQTRFQDTIAFQNPQELQRTPSHASDRNTQNDTDRHLHAHATSRFLLSECA